MPNCLVAMAVPMPVKARLLVMSIGCRAPYKEWTTPLPVSGSPMRSSSARVDLLLRRLLPQDTPGIRASPRSL
ncbi:hypothetical protein D3C86_1989590 [compost metagenome]